MLRTSWYYLGVSKRAVRMISRKGRNLSTSFFSMFRFQWKILIDRANKGEAEDVKAPSAGAKSLCIPHDQARFGEFPEGENQKCVQCGEKAKRWTLFGRSKFFL
jgi:prolyl-tRNA synthetase